MAQDNTKGKSSLISALENYSELYPDIIPRLREIQTSTNPEVRKRLVAMNGAFAAREADRINRLTRTYNLTRTEVRLACYLADGGTVAGYSDLFGVAQGTVRSHLKSIFAKTGANRQAALVSIVGPQ